MDLPHRNRSPEGFRHRGCRRCCSGRYTIELFGGQSMPTGGMEQRHCLPLVLSSTSLGSIVKVEFWAETRSAESAERTTKERILEQLVVLVELVRVNTVADGSVSVLSEAGPSELIVIRMNVDQSARQLK